MNSAFESPYVPEEVSPWWLKGLAIFMALISIFMLLSVASGVLTPMFVDRLMPEDFEEIEPYPEDGTDEEKAEWTENDEFWDDMLEYMDGMMGLLKFQAFHSGILAIIGLFSVPVLWRGERDSVSCIAEPTISEFRVKGSCPRGVSLWEPSLKSSNEADSEISRLSFGFQYSEPLYER